MGTLIALVIVLGGAVPAAVPSADDPCPGYCSPIGCGESKASYTLLQGSYVYDTEDHGAHGCDFEACKVDDPRSGVHSPCNDTFVSNDDYEVLALAAANGDAGELSRLLEKYASSVSLNVKRHSIQVAECGGGIRSNFPVSEAVLTSLASQE
jgi:hypothetical protein